MICPLCESSSFSPYSKDRQREYFVCNVCTLIYVSRESIIDAAKERARYDTHQNNDNDEQYRNYLGQTIKEIMPYISAGETGLDFGSGRTDLMARLLTEAGIPSEAYDLYYFPREEIWAKTFDVIMMSEVIEHLRDLRSTMEKVRKLLNPGGRLFIKTKLQPVNKESFDRWYYKTDPTHVEFFNSQSFEKLSEILRMERPVFLGSDVVMVRASR